MASELSDIAQELEGVEIDLNLNDHYSEEWNEAARRWIDLTQRKTELTQPTTIPDPTDQARTVSAELEQVRGTIRGMLDRGEQLIQDDEGLKDLRSLTEREEQLARRSAYVGIDDDTITQSAEDARIRREELIDAAKSYGPGSARAAKATREAEAAHMEALGFELEAKERRGREAALKTVSDHTDRLARNAAVREWNVRMTARVTQAEKDHQAGKIQKWELDRVKAEAGMPIPAALVAGIRDDRMARAASKPGGGYLDPRRPV